jgi:heat shock protein HslJ
MTKKYPGIVCVVILSLVMAACGQRPNAIDLEGTHWVLIEMDGHPPIAGRSITLGFEDGEVRGHLGCNSFSGSYSLRGDTLEFGLLMSTLMACVDDDLMQQEGRMFELLGQVERVQFVDGRLHLLLSGGERLIYAPTE